MPSELQRIAQGLVDCLDEAPRVIAALEYRARLCREHAVLVLQLSGGTATVAAQQLDAAARACEAAAHHLSLAPPKARDWALRLAEGISSGPAADGTASKPDAPGGRRPPTDRRPDDDRTEPVRATSGKTAKAGDEATPDAGWPPKLDDDEARDLLAQLPVRRDQPGHREKTNGAWRDPNGYVQRMISGVDRYREIGDRFAKQRQLGDPPHSLAVTSHVEIKFAMFMRERGLTDEAIVINKATCDGRWSCEKMLKDFLPPGSRLVVHGPDGIGRSYYGKGDS